MSATRTVSLAICKHTQVVHIRVEGFLNCALGRAKHEDVNLHKRLQTFGVQIVLLACKSAKAMTGKE